MAAGYTPGLAQSTYWARGTPGYRAPELLNESRYTNKVDVWAMGCILYELVTGRKAFDTDQVVRDQSLQMTFSGEGILLPLNSEALPDENRRQFVSNQLECMLQVVPENRAEAFVLKNDWADRIQETTRSSMPEMTRSTTMDMERFSSETTSQGHVSQNGRPVERGHGTTPGKTRASRPRKKEILATCERRIQEISTTLGRSQEQLTHRREVREWYRAVFCEVNGYGLSNLWDDTDVNDVMNSLAQSLSGQRSSRAANGSVEELKPSHAVPRRGKLDLYVFSPKGEYVALLQKLQKKVKRPRWFIFEIDEHARTLHLQRYGPYQPKFYDSGLGESGNDSDPLTEISCAALNDRFLVVGSAGQPGNIQVIPIMRDRNKASAGYNIRVCDAIIALCFTSDQKELIILGREGLDNEYAIFTWDATLVRSNKIVKLSQTWVDKARRHEGWITIASQSNYIAAVTPLADRAGLAIIHLWRKLENDCQWEGIGQVEIPVENPRPPVQGRITSVVL